MGKNFQLYFSIALLTLLFSCASEKSIAHQESRKPFSNASSIEPITVHLQDKGPVISEYQAYIAASDDLIKENPLTALNFLRVYRDDNDGLSAEIRNHLLNYFAVREDWMPFKTEYDHLQAQEKNLGLRCYAAIYYGPSSQRTKLSQMLVHSNEILPVGCNKLLNIVARGGILPNSELLRRARVLIANGYTSASRDLLTAAHLDASREAAELTLLQAYITPVARRQAKQRGMVDRLSSSVSPANFDFAQGMAGLGAAKDRDMASAIAHFSKANPQALSNEAWEWYARAALFLGNWRVLDRVIGQMPLTLQHSPTWLYWRGRAKTALGQKKAAQKLYSKSITSGINYYAILSAEELKQKINIHSVALPTQSDIERIKRNPQLQKAIILFHESVINQDIRQRKAAQTLWKYAIHGLRDEDLLAAAGLAALIGFNEMAIESADQSGGKLNFQLRFPVYEKNILSALSRRYGVELALILGLIRQDNRFIQGVYPYSRTVNWMQVPPMAARYIAQKTDISYSATNEKTLFNNLEMGTWYLADLYRQFGSELLAIVAYHAGPNCVRQWHTSGIEGAIYVETIPSDETRIYVQEVLKNIYYYDYLFNQNPRRSLKKRLGMME